MLGRQEDPWDLVAQLKRTSSRFIERQLKRRLWREIEATHVCAHARTHTRTPPTYVCAHTCIGTAYEKTGEHSRVMLWSLAMLISPNGWWDWGHWLPTDTGNRRR